jgi:hypothetical protein
MWKKVASFVALLFMLIFHLTAFANIYPKDEVKITGMDADNLPNLILYVHIPGFLKYKNFKIYEDDNCIRSFKVKEKIKEKSAVAVVIDRSGSMENVIGEVKNNVSFVLKNIDSESNTALFTFSTNTTLNAAGKPLDIIKHLNDITAHDSTALYDALYQATEWINSQKGSKTIILFTDGKDNASFTSFKKVASLINNSYINLIIVGYTGNEGIDEFQLSELAGKTSGIFIRADNKEQFKTLFDWQKTQFQNNVRVDISLLNITPGVHYIKVSTAVGGQEYFDIKPLMITAGLPDKVTLREPSTKVSIKAYNPTLFQRIIDWLTQKHQIKFLTKLFYIPVIGSILGYLASAFIGINSDGTFSYGDLILNIVLTFFVFGRLFKFLGGLLGILARNAPRFLKALSITASFVKGGMIEKILAKLFGETETETFKLWRLSVDVFKNLRKISKGFSFDVIFDMRSTAVKSKEIFNTKLGNQLLNKIIEKDAKQELYIKESVDKALDAWKKVSNKIPDGVKKFANSSVEKIQSVTEAKDSIKEIYETYTDVTDRNKNTSEKLKKFLKKLLNLNIFEE